MIYARNSVFDVPCGHLDFPLMPTACLIGEGRDPTGMDYRCCCGLKRLELMFLIADESAVLGY
jgi:hypothetical protein